ncbi:hypothetical protein NP493_770g00010 [Ridgeia piscesae]|uniref:DUF4371 domain-containing protein n=1 Tax=Ridgeia piscesae TaxID=27915 RepID=A0AAD9NLP1_RIDPI|nr:hypothetical protein NP493_770g00010 [Ridgeia piscesae]
MVLHYSDDLLKTPDPNGGKFGDWIVKKDTFNVTCRPCKSNVCIKEGEKALAKHSSSAKHHKAKGAQAGTGNIFQAFAQQDAKQREQKSCEEKARDAELIYLHHIEAHGIPPHVASCTTLLFKQMFPDSKIAEKFTFSDSKQGYEITHGLGQHYNTRLVNRLQQEYFSINIDESTVLKTNQLAITVRYFHRGVKRVVTEHYKTVEIGKKDADSLVSVLHETFTADGIDYKSQLLHIETDSCPAMRGVRGGVITKMKTKVEYLYDLGGCPDHHIANALKYALLAFDYYYCLYLF